MTPDYEKRIQNLEKELDEARFDIISLAPYEFRLALRSFMSLESWEEFEISIHGETRLCNDLCRLARTGAHVEE